MWFVANAEIIDQEGWEIIVVCEGSTYDDAINKLRQQAAKLRYCPYQLTCINCDYLSEETAKSYGVPFSDDEEPEERLFTRWTANGVT